MNHKERQFFYIAFVVSVLISLPFIQTLGDDSFIYMRQIDRLIESGRPEYNPGEPCYGMTSITWFYAWVAMKMLTGDFDTSRYIISLGSHILAFVLVTQLARKLIKDPLVVLVVVCAFAFNPFYLRWFWSGWEMSAKIAAAAWPLLALIRCSEPGATWRSVFVAGLATGVGMLTRPEMLVLAALGMAYLALVRRQQLLSTWLVFLCAAALVVTPWLIYAQHTFGWLLPHTVYAKTGNVIDAQYLAASSKRLAQILVGPDLAFLAAGAYFFWRARPDFMKQVAPLKFWAYPSELLSFLLVLGWGCVVFGYLKSGAYIESQKTGLFSPFLLIAIGALAQRGFSQARFKHIAVAAVVGGQLALSVLIEQQLFYRFSWFNPEYRQGEDQDLIAFSKKVKELTSEKDKIGLWELGVVGYYSERYIVDFIGLGTPDIVRYKLKYGGEEGNYVGRYLADHGGPPSHIVYTIPGHSDESENDPKMFFGSRYTPVFHQVVQRIGGREAHNMTRYVLFKKDTAQP